MAYGHATGNQDEESATGFVAFIIVITAIAATVVSVLVLMGNGTLKF